MNKTFYLLCTCFLLAVSAFTQSVGINNNTPHASAILDVKSFNKGMLLPRTSTTSRNAIANPAKGLILYDTTASSFYFYNGAAWTQLGGGDYWSLNGANLFNNNGGNVGIGTTAPAYPLTVQTQANQFGFSQIGGDVTLSTYIGTFQGVLGGWLGTRSNHPLFFYTNNSAQQMTLLPNGNVGIGSVNPLNKLQIGAGYAGFSTYDFVFGDGIHATGFIQQPTVSYWHSLNTNIAIVPGTGNLGINITTPANKLQIGNLGASGFNGNDLAIGNGTSAMAVYQSNSSTQFASTTDFAFLPRYGSGGRIGINTSTPRAPLDVAGFADIYQTYDYLNLTGSISGIKRCEFCIAGVSIYASRGVMAQEFDAISDARVKLVIGTSNAVQDLAIINALSIMNYKMKDHVQFGSKIYKKVVAQEVEKVYPQVVSKHTGFIPNVYQLSNTIRKTENGYLLIFEKDHHMSKQAKKLQILFEGSSGMQQVNIVAIPSSHEVVIDVPEIKGDKTFVYGEEVDDFRTVDYEGLTTLNISATQELSKLVKQQANAIQQQNKRIAALEMAIASLQKNLSLKSKKE